VEEDWNVGWVEPLRDVETFSFSLARVCSDPTMTASYTVAAQVNDVRTRPFTTGTPVLSVVIRVTAHAAPFTQTTAAFVNHFAATLFTESHFQMYVFFSSSQSVLSSLTGMNHAPGLLP